MNDPWVKAPDKGGQVTSVAITAQGKILGVGKDSKLYFRDSLDDPWVRAPNDSGSLKGVAVARDGTILGIGKMTLFRYSTVFNFIFPHFDFSLFKM